MTLLGMRVLVVEDDSLICMMIEEFLDDLGCKVAATAAELQDGLAKARTTPIDVAVLDINLDGQLSYPIAVELKGREIPFLFATGYGQSGVPLDFKSAPVLSKPFGMHDLQMALCRATTGS